MEQLWGKIKELLKYKIAKDSFDVWIEPLTYRGYENNTLILNCPNQFFATWVRDNYLTLIKEELRKQNINVTIKFLPVEFKLNSAKGQLHLPQFSPTQLVYPKLCSRFTFDEFVVGNCNRFAHAACWALANEETNHSKVVYIQSSTGLGKSHLAQAVGNHLLKRKPKLRIIYVTANEFTSQIVKAIKTGQLDVLKKRYKQDCEIFLLEEVHCFSGRERTQSELATAIDALVDYGKTVLFTSSKLPREIPNVNSKLRSRLSSGLIISINPPGFSTRKKILERKARSQGLELDENILNYLAEHLRGDIRQIESAIIGLLAKSSLLHESVSIELAKEVVKDLVGEDRVITMADITRLICRHFKVTQEELRSKSRKKTIAWPRQIAMYLARHYTEASLEAIGKEFNRDHATVIHSVKRITRQIKESKQLKNQIRFLMDRLEGQIWQD